MPWNSRYPIIYFEQKWWNNMWKCCVCVFFRCVWNRQCLNWLSLRFNFAQPMINMVLFCCSIHHFLRRCWKISCNTFCCGGLRYTWEYSTLLFSCSIYTLESHMIFKLNAFGLRLFLHEISPHGISICLPILI